MPALAALGQKPQAVCPDTLLGVASKAARKLEEELERAALGIKAPKPPDHVTIDATLALYLVDRSQRGIKDPSKAQRLLGRLRDYAYARNAILLKEVSARMLTEWRATWTFNKDSSGPAVSWSIVKTFFRLAHSIDLVSSNASATLTSLPVVRKQVQPLTKDEMAALLTATSQCGFSPEIEERVRVFNLLQRWSGLGCVDAATLSTGHRQEVVPPLQLPQGGVRFIPADFPTVEGVVEVDHVYPTITLTAKRLLTRLRPWRWYTAAFSTSSIF